VNCGFGLRRFLPLTGREFLTLLRTLLGPSHPLDVARLVVSFVAKPAECRSCGARSHALKKCFKRVPPTVADSDTARAVVQIVLVTRVVAALNRVPPATVLGRVVSEPRVTVLDACFCPEWLQSFHSCCGEFSAQTFATCAVTASQMTASNNFLSPANASAEKLCRAVLIVFCTAQHRSPAERHAG